MRNRVFPSIVLSALVLITFATLASAANCRVTKAADTNDGSCTGLDCSLREAVAEPSCTTIDFALNLVDVPVILSQGEIVIGRSLAISGYAPDAINISTNFTSRIFYIGKGTNVSISGVTLSGGNGVGTAPNNGGAVRNLGILALNNVFVTGNTAPSSVLGSGIAYEGPAGSTIRNSLFADNNATGTQNAAVATKAGSGGVEIYNSTFALNNGVAIYLVGSNVKLINSTVVMNALGIWVGGTASLTIGNSIATDICRCSMLGGVGSSGNNIVSSSTFSNQIVFSGSDLVGVDPLLPLQMERNGGPTANFALLPGSPAIDGGNNTLATNAGLTTDQRGFSRIADGNGDTIAIVDIGAHEHLGVPPAPSGLVTVAGRLFDSAGRPVANANVLLSDTNGNFRSTFTSGLGWFQFGNVPKDQVYRINISSKRHTAPQRVILPAADIFDADIITQ